MLNYQCKWRLTWSPKRMDSTNLKRLPANAHAHRDDFEARLPWQNMVKLNKGRVFVMTKTQFDIQSQVMQQSNCTERPRVDATIMRSFQTELLSSFLPSTHAGQVNLAAVKPWQSMANGKDGSTVKIYYFSCLTFRFCLSIVSYIMIIL